MWMSSMSTLEILAWSHRPKSMASHLIADDLEESVQLRMVMSRSGRPGLDTRLALVLPDAKTMQSSPVRK